jgi:hypothetical protein
MSRSNVCKLSTKFVLLGPGLCGSKSPSASKLDVRRAEHISPAFASLKGRVEALYVCQDLLMLTDRIEINTLALGARVSAMLASVEQAEA